MFTIPTYGWLTWHLTLGFHFHFHIRHPTSAAEMRCFTVGQSKAPHRERSSACFDRLVLLRKSSPETRVFDHQMGWGSWLRFSIMEFYDLKLRMRPQNSRTVDVCKILHQLMVYTLVYRFQPSKVVQDFFQPQSHCMVSSCILPICLLIAYIDHV